MRLPRPKESEVLRACQAVLHMRRVPHFRNNTGTAMLPGRGGKPMPVKFGAPGWPDLIGILPSGRFIGVECKRPLGPRGGSGGSEQTPGQRAVQQTIEAAGGLYVLARSAQDVEDAIKGGSGKA